MLVENNRGRFVTSSILRRERKRPCARVGGRYNRSVIKPEYVKSPPDHEG